MSSNDATNGIKNLSVQNDRCINVEIPEYNALFTVCLVETGVKITYNGKEAELSLKYFRNPLALRAILDQEFLIDLRDPLNSRAAFLIEENKEINKLLDSQDGVPIPEVCVHFNDAFNDCIQTVVLTKEGLKLQNYSFRHESKEVQKIPHDSLYLLKGKITKIRKVELRGVSVAENLIKLDINNSSIIGTLDDIIEKLKDNALDTTKKHLVSQFINDNVTAENLSVTEEMFYSSGPWIVNNSIVVAERAGYLPRWKENKNYSLARGGDIENGIKLLAQIINAYKNPSKAMTILSYGIIAWAKHYFVEKFQYFPHLVISGQEHVGKSMLVDTLRVLYNLQEEEVSPKSDFQLRKILAKSTVPAMLTEGNYFSSFMQSNEKLLATLTMASTTNVISETGSKEYGGLFLGIRSLIMPTNLDVDSLPSFVKDKMIIIDIPKDEGYTEVPTVKTPKRMTNKDKNDVATVFTESLTLFQNRLNDINVSLSSGTRDDAVKYYIKLGYSILSEIASRYNVKLPEPYIPETVEGDETVSEVLKDGFTQFINEKKQSILKVVGDPAHVDFIDPRDAKAALDAYGFFIDVRRSLVVCNMSFLTEYSIAVTRKYGLPKYSWRRVADILGIKRTTIKRYDKPLNNVFEIKLDNGQQEYCKSLDHKTPTSDDLSYCGQYGYYDNEQGVFIYISDDDDTTESGPPPPD